MDVAERQRRHDERWQHEVLDGMARMLDVLHDISDSLQGVALKIDERAAPEPSTPTSSDDRLLTIDEVATRLTISPDTVRRHVRSGSFIPVTRVGRRVLFDRQVVDRWLSAQQEKQGDVPWKSRYQPGRIGSQLPASSEPKRTAYCSGSQTEPMAASRYAGMGICRICQGDVRMNRDGRLRKHRPVF